MVFLTGAANFAANAASRISFRTLIGKPVSSALSSPLPTPKAAHSDLVIEPGLQSGTAFFFQLCANFTGSL
jgi:hypothetical protein